VYQDARNGNWDIYVYTVEGGVEPEARVTTNTANQMEPSIFGNLIVYQDDRNGNWDIYMYDLLSQTETRITTNTATQQYPDIEGNRIVWQDNRNGNLDVYMYDLTTQTERRVTTTSSNRNPAISGDLIAYEKTVTANNAQRYVIYYFDLSTNAEAQVPGTLDQKSNPAISGTRIVYQTPEIFELETQNEIIMQDVASEATWKTNNAADQEKPDINENLIVYEDHRTYTMYVGYTSDIYLYNIDSQTINQVTSDSKNQVSPAVHGGRIVYMDDRNGNWDIYMTTVAYATAAPTPSTPPRVWAPGPSSTESETENPPLIPNEFIILATIALITAIITSIILAIIYEKHNSRKPAKKTAENT